MISLAHSAPATLSETCHRHAGRGEQRHHLGAAGEGPDHQFAAAVVLEMARGRPSRWRHRPRRETPAPERRLQARGIVVAVLQAEDDRIGREVRRHFRGGIRRIGGLDAAQHQLRAPHAAGIEAGVDPYMLAKGLRIHQQAVAADRLDVLRPPDQHHLPSGTSQHPAVVAAHRPAPITATFISPAPQCTSPDEKCGTSRGRDLAICIVPGHLALRRATPDQPQLALPCRQSLSRIRHGARSMAALGNISGDGRRSCFRFRMEVPRGF
jgi:hypothetical protein